MNENVFKAEFNNFDSLSPDAGGCLENRDQEEESADNGSPLPSFHPFEDYESDGQGNWNEVVEENDRVEHIQDTLSDTGENIISKQKEVPSASDHILFTPELERDTQPNHAWLLAGVQKSKRGYLKRKSLQIPVYVRGIDMCHSVTAVAVGASHMMVLLSKRHRPNFYCPFVTVMFIMFAC